MNNFIHIITHEILQLPRYMGIETSYKLEVCLKNLLQLPRYMGIETSATLL